MKTILHSVGIRLTWTQSIDVPTLKRFELLNQLDTNSPLGKGLPGSKHAINFRAPLWTVMLCSGNETLCHFISLTIRAYSENQMDRATESAPHKVLTVLMRAEILRYKNSQLRDNSWKCKFKHKMYIPFKIYYLKQLGLAHNH